MRKPSWLYWPRGKVLAGLGVAAGLVGIFFLDPLNLDAQGTVPPDHDRLCVLEDLMSVDNPWCDPVGTSTVAPTTVAPTTVAPTTVPPTTEAPTTTAAPTTTQAPTTTTTTTPPPTGDVLFREDFTGDDIEDFKATFDWSVIDLWRRSNGWQGHHDLMCGNPTTERTVHHVWPASNTEPGEEFWLCGAPAVANDHLMTSNGDNGTFGITAFTPKQSFNRSTARRVCWDVNTTISRGRRLWFEVQLVNANAIAANRSLASQGLMVGGVDFERGTAFIGYGRGVDGTMMKRAWPNDSLVFDYTEELVTIWQGQTSRFHSPWEERFAPEDRATRWHHCLIDNNNGTVTFEAGRPQGFPGSVNGVYRRTVTGSFPAVYRPIFSAHNYNAGKDGTQPFQTWHWDNIEVAAS